MVADTERGLYQSLSYFGVSSGNAHRVVDVPPRAPNCAFRAYLRMHWNVHLVAHTYNTVDGTQCFLLGQLPALGDTNRQGELRDEF